MQVLTQPSHLILLNNERQFANLSRHFIIQWVFGIRLEIAVELLEVVFVGGGHAEGEGVQAGRHVAVVGVHEEVAAEVEDVGFTVYSVPGALE